MSEPGTPDVPAAGLDSDPVIETEGADGEGMADAIPSLGGGADADEALAAITAERDSYRALAQRVQADFENYRKRSLTQSAEQADRATGKLAEALLPVLDACELAYQHGAEGVEPVWSKLLGEMQRQGLEAMDLLGKPFDPNEAEAVVHEPGDESAPAVAEVLRTGYRWKGRVLRAAMVKVKG